MKNQNKYNHDKRRYASEAVRFFLNRWRDEMEGKNLNNPKEDWMTGWDVVQENIDGDAYRHVSGLIVIVSFAEEEDGKVWQHLSASYRSRTPSHREMVMLRDLFIGKDRYAYTVLPPKEFYVNIHPNCLHLWHRCENDGPGKVLPEFSGFLPKSNMRSI